MGLNVNYVIVDKTLTKIKSIFGDIPKDKQESLTDDVLDFLEKMEKKYKNIKNEKDSKKVYLIDLIDYEFDSSPLDWSDEKFKNEAKIQGNVYSLSSFVKEWNSENIIFESFIRIL